MLPKPVDIPFPFKGLAETFALDRQVPNTSMALRNVRGRDPKTTRIRGAQRSGITQYVNEQVFPDFAQELVQVTIDTNLTTYTVRDTSSGPSVEWKKTVNGKDAVADIAVTRGGDVFAATPPDKLSKYTSEGSWLFTEQVPTSSEDEYISAVVVDTLDNVFVAVRTGGATRYGGRVIRYEQSDDGLVETWNLDMNDAQPVDLALQGDRLVVLTRKSGGGEIVVYNSLGASSPNVLWDRSVPSKGVGVDLNDDGDVFAVFDSDDTRDDVTPGDCNNPSIAWNPNDLPTSTLWSWYDAQQMTGITDREILDVIPDWSGNQRDLYAAPAGYAPVIEFPGSWGVRFAKNSFCIYDGFRFEAERRDGKVSGVASGFGTNSAFPIHTNEPFAVVMLIKSPGSGEGEAKFFETGGKPYTTMWQSQNGRGLSLGFSDPGPSDTDSTDPNQTRQGNILNAGNGRLRAPDVCVVSFGYSPTSHDDGVAGYSFLRVNGETIDAFTVDDVRVDTGVQFGYSVYAGEATNWGHFKGDLIEMVVISGAYDLPTLASPFGAAGPDAEPSPITPPRYIWPANGASPNGNPAEYTDGTEYITKLEGYLAHRYGQQDKLATGHAYRAAPPGHGASGASPNSTDDTSEARKLDSTSEILAKFGSGSGSLRWARVGNGYGYGVRVRDEWVYTIGRGFLVASPDNSITLRRIKDEGFTADDSGAGTYELAEQQPKLSNDSKDDILPIRLDVDSDHNLYVPVKSGAPGGDDFSIRKITSAGTTEWEFKCPITGASPNVSYMWGRVCSLDTISDIPERESIGEPEFVYLGIDHDTPGNEEPTLFKLRLVDASVRLGAPREKRIIGLGGGVFKKIVRGAATEVTAITNNGATPSAIARVARGAVLNENAFFVDGRDQWYYDPDTDTMEAWSATSGGTLPKRPRLIEAWRGRLVLARTEGKGGNIYMSKVGDPFDWDLYPPVISAVQAVSLEVASAGQVPDIVNGLIPYNDDLLIILCDHSIYRLTGDPMANGKLDSITNSIGGAFGRAWCMDDIGIIYFFGSRGGLYRMVPGRWMPELVSDNRLDRRLDSIDLDFYTVRMAWNDKDKTVHMFVVPIDTVGASPSGPTASPPASPGASPTASPVASPTPASPSGGPVNPGGDFGGAFDPDLHIAASTTAADPLTHWVWERPTDGLFEDKFALSSLDPTAILVVDGDEPDDRVLLMGCGDGYLRAWDRDATSDDGSAIDAFVVIGPLQPQEAHARVRWNDWEITLSPGQNGATVELFASENAENEGPVFKTFTVAAGRNSGLKHRVKASYVWLKIGNSTVNERFAIEEIAAQWQLAGRAR